MILDEKVKEIFSKENFIEQFKIYKSLKTDRYTKVVKVQMGVDGIDWKNFHKNIDTISVHTCKRAQEGRFFFSPFREHEVPKPPYTNLEDARKEDKTRTLSIATIKDVIFQKLFYTAIEDYCESKFNELDYQVSYGYRRGKSAPLAVQNIYHTIKNEEYLYALDGDIQKFFDEIPHDMLYEKIVDFIGPENRLVTTYLKRFYSSDRVPFDDYKGNVEKYYRQKPKRINREKGIPQGGVLSGLVANIYLHDFDSFIVNELYPRYEYKIKYFRYADDFVVLFKDKDHIKTVFNEIKEFLLKHGLCVHEIGDKDKTKEIHMSQIKREKLGFLGFEISPKGIGVKKTNIIKFKTRLREKIQETKIYKTRPGKGLNILVEKIRFKILGNHAFNVELNICGHCGKEMPKRNWLSYFSIITDVRVLRALDIWIRKNVYRHYYYRTENRLRKVDISNYGLPSLEKHYYEYKKEIASSREKHYCKCTSYIYEEEEAF